MKKKINLEKDLKLMVALDLTEMDPILLGYVSFLCEVWGIEHLYFTHNIKQYKIYDLYDEFLEKGITIEDIVDRGLTETIETYYTGKVPFTILITNEDYTESILSHLADTYKIDIVIVGNKDELQGTGALNQKLARMLNAHVLLVPEEAKHRFERVLVPTDFSANSFKSFEVAQTLVERSGGEIESLHVYNIPSFFFPYINTEKAIDKTNDHLKERVKQFRKRFKLPETIPFKYTDRRDMSVVEAIELHADKGNFDIVIVSARGGSKLTALFVGSLTNDLLIRNRKMPLLVVH